MVWPRLIIVHGMGMEAFLGFLIFIGFPLLMLYVLWTTVNKPIGGFSDDDRVGIQEGMLIYLKRLPKKRRIKLILLMGFAFIFYVASSLYSVFSFVD